jgi:hypothetical protein
VSIAAETIGVWRVISLVNFEETSTLLGRTSECAGISKTSSKVKPSIICELVNVCISCIKFGKCNNIFGNSKDLEGFFDDSASNFMAYPLHLPAASTLPSLQTSPLGEEAYHRFAENNIFGIYKDLEGFFDDL